MLRGACHSRATRAPTLVRTQRLAAPRAPRAISTCLPERRACTLQRPPVAAYTLSVPSFSGFFRCAQALRTPPAHVHVASPVFPRQFSDRDAALRTKFAPQTIDPHSVFSILAALILGATIAFLKDDQADAEERLATPPMPSERVAAEYAQARMTVDEIRERTTPFFRITEPPQDLTIAERAYDAFWAAIETIRMFLRVIELSIRFAPLLITFPLLFTRFADTWYRILLSTFRKSGACFIKLGQWAATRKDIFPDELTSRLSTLHTQAPFHTLGETREVMRRVYGREIEELFDEFNPEPIASGAIAQVYRARLKTAKLDSGDLILKVRHPGVAEQIERDLRILRRAVQIFEVILGLGWLHPVETVDVFRSNMLAQIDLAVEAANLERFRANFAGVTTVRFPRPLRMLCRPEVLVETFEEGKHVSEFVNSMVDPKLRRSIASLGMDTYLKMMIEDSFTHADLHPGNILVDTRSQPPQIVIVDCGLVVRLSQKDRRNFINLFSAVVESDSQLAARLMTEDQPHLSQKAIREFGQAIRAPIEELSQKGLAQINVSQVMGGILAAARKHRVRVDPAFTTLVVGTAVLEGLGRQLDPDINLISHAAPFLRGEPAARRAYIRAKLNRGLFNFS